MKEVTFVTIWNNECKIIYISKNAPMNLYECEDPRALGSLPGCFKLRKRAWSLALICHVISLYNFNVNNGVAVIGETCGEFPGAIHCCMLCRVMCLQKQHCFQLPRTSPLSMFKLEIESFVKGTNARRSGATKMSTWHYMYIWMVIY